ncbi:D-fructose-6-phosphate amidotransferase [Vibrio fluvialis]|uniref:D-fructose-6-phosphate amidotransferase n=1 Tax=Vibrio fluvialis TaxID=676 RepID=UPI00192B1F35|nr:D-fructose-6-phosphate amidotransferase [Vibrio fluvialis]EKO3384158.1 D-fructose-6-phosphate amidotransferase [Vibrio fluvialis]MBL4280145.1 D-fructose-6-phosphate amidotransferase [Vibrio fluvialis]
MTASKMFLRDLLGLILIVSTVLALLSVLLDLLALLAYVNHETQVATLLFDESFYLLVFFIPPYFIAKYINRAEVVKAVDEYQLMKSKSEIM